MLNVRGADYECAAHQSFIAAPGNRSDAFITRSAAAGSDTSLRNYIKAEKQGFRADVQRWELLIQFMLISGQIARTDKNLSVLISAAALIGKRSTRLFCLVKTQLGESLQPPDGKSSQLRVGGELH